MDDHDVMTALFNALARDPELLEAFLKDPESILDARNVTHDARAKLLRGGAWAAACDAILDGDLRPRWAGEPVRVRTATAAPSPVKAGEELRIEIVGAFLAARRVFVHLQNQSTLGDWCRPVSLPAEIESIADGSVPYRTKLVARCTIPEMAPPGTYLLHVTGIPFDVTPSTGAEDVSFDIVRDFVEVLPKG